MKNITYKHILYWILFSMSVISGCKKEDAFLDTKPNDALAVPASLGDLQLLVQNEAVFNRLSFPVLGEVSCDDYYVTDDIYTSGTTSDRNACIWAKQIYDAGSNNNDWSDSYNQVYYANTILYYLPKIGAGSGQQSVYNQIEGSALFFRAMAFYGLVQTFALPYDSKTAGTDLGIPLRLSPDLNIKSVRSSMQDSYNQILQDLKTAGPLLPATANPITRPSKAAVYGLLARVYQVMGNTAAALQNADSCLNIIHTLQNFNNLTPGAFPVYPNYSPEEIFHCSLNGSYFTGFQSLLDSSLYKLYNDPNDLRPGVFFRYHSGLIGFLSQFDKRNSTYCGISTNEIYLIKAECEARSGNTSSAMSDLNTLLINRWKTGAFVPLQATDSDDALIQILNERRKELVMTGLRWSDLRRLNTDSRFAVTLRRIINGVEYTLPPNDPRYALPIPDNEIQLSGIQQNPR